MTQSLWAQGDEGAARSESVGCKGRGQGPRHSHGHTSTVSASP